MHQSAVLLFDSVKSYKNFVFTDKYFRRFHFVVQCSGATIIEIAMLRTTVYNRFLLGVLINHNLIIEDDESIKLMAFAFYTERRCKALQLVENELIR